MKTVNAYHAILKLFSIDNQYPHSKHILVSHENRISSYLNSDAQDEVAKLFSGLQKASAAGEICCFQYSMDHEPLVFRSSLEQIFSGNLIENGELTKKCDEI